jgi:putative tricarboxylic transport membrane protein
MIGVLAGCAVLSGCGGGTQATPYPAQAINVLVPFGTGASTNFVKALEAASAPPVLAQAMTLENMPGADGTAAGMAMLTRPADGYQLLEGIAGSLIIGPIVDKVPSVKWDAFEPVARIHGEEEFLFVKSGSPYHSIEDLVNATKTSTGTIKFTGSVLAGTDSFVFQLFQKAAMLTHVKYDPYNGGGPALTAFQAGMEDVYIGNYGDLSDLVAANSVAPIAVASEARSPIAPNVPTLKEKGWDVVLIEWRGIMAPKGTPQDRIQTLADAFQKALMTDSWSMFRMKSQSVDLYLNPTDFKTFLMSQEANLSQIIHDLGLGG